MKLPKLPAQWEALDQFAKDRIDEASDQAAAFLVYAGYSTPQDLDENGEEIGDAVQALLMDAMLRAPHLYLHISKLNELTANPERDVDFDTARSDFMTWARNAPLADLRSVRTMREATLASEFDPMSHMELQIVTTEINLRLANESSSPEEQQALARIKPLPHPNLPASHWRNKP